MRKTVLAAMGMAFGLCLVSAHAQQLQMTGAAPAATRAGVPTRGLTMDQVEQQYGAPGERLAAVGRPPIARWVYPSFVVYFEGNRVIHAVAASGGPPAQ
jgi:hypothetical protein